MQRRSGICLVTPGCGKPVAAHMSSERRIVPAPPRCYDPPRSPRSPARDPRVRSHCMQGKMKILAGNSNAPLAVAIAAHGGEPLTRCSVRRFADLEIFVEILENVRGRDAFIVQSTSYPTNDNLMELLIMIDPLRRGSAQRITPA